MKLPGWAIKSYRYHRHARYALPLAMIILVAGNVLLIAGAAMGQGTILGLGVLLTLLGVIFVISVLWRLGYFTNPLKYLKFE